MKLQTTTVILSICFLLCFFVNGCTSEEPATANTILYESSVDLLYSSDDSTTGNISSSDIEQLGKIGYELINVNKEKILTKVNVTANEQSISLSMTELQRQISFETISETGIIRITVQSEKAETAEILCDIAAKSTSSTLPDFKQVNYPSQAKVIEEVISK